MRKKYINAYKWKANKKNRTGPPVLGIMSQFGICRIWHYVAFGIMSHSALCRILGYVVRHNVVRHYVTFGVMSFGIMSHLALSH